VFLKTDVIGHAAVLSALGRHPNLEKSSEDHKRDETVYSYVYWNVHHLDS